MALSLLAMAARAQDDTASEAGGELLDRVVALVDEEPILASDIEQVIGLGLVERQEDEPEELLRRRALDRLIEERLRFHEIDRFGFTEISLDAVADGFAAIREGFSSDTAFDQRLRELGLTEDALRQLVARQIMVLTYVDERLGPRVFVSLDEIRAYYQNTLVPEMRARRQQAPPIEDVREQIRQVLREQRLNEELERWTQELRLEADVEDYFDTEAEDLPAHVLGQKELD